MRQKTPVEVQAEQEYLQQQRQEASEECALFLYGIIEKEFQKPDGAKKYSQKDILHFVAQWNEGRKSDEPHADGRIVYDALVDLLEGDIDEKRTPRCISAIQEETSNAARNTTRY